MRNWCRFFVAFVMINSPGTLAKKKKATRKKARSSQQGQWSKRNTTKILLEKLGPLANVNKCDEFASSFWEQRTGHILEAQNQHFIDPLSNTSSLSPLFDALEKAAPDSSVHMRNISETRVVWLRLMQLGHDFVLELRRNESTGKLEARLFSAWIKESGNSEDPAFAFSPDMKRIVSTVVEKSAPDNEWAARTGYSASEWVRAPGRCVWWDQDQLKAKIQAIEELHRRIGQLVAGHLLECAANFIVQYDKIDRQYHRQARESVRVVSPDNDELDLAEEIRQIVESPTHEFRLRASDWANNIVNDFQAGGMALRQQPNNVLDDGYAKFLDEHGLPPHVVVFRQRDSNSPEQLLDFPLIDALSIVELVSELFGEHPRGLSWLKMLTYTAPGSIALVVGDGLVSTNNGGNESTSSNPSNSGASEPMYSQSKARISSRNQERDIREPRNDL